MCPFLPDSPRLLIRKGQHEQALEVLAALEGNGATPTSPTVKAQFNVIKDILDRENMVSYSWWELLSGKGRLFSRFSYIGAPWLTVDIGPSGVLRRMILGAWMQAMNQISGINITS
jgi:hypothetical protein